MKPESISRFSFIYIVTMAKKKFVEEPVEEVVEAPKAESLKKEVKEWTYDELVLLPREEYLAVAADIKAGKAKVKPL